METLILGHFFLHSSIQQIFIRVSFTHPSPAGPRVRDPVSFPEQGQGRGPWRGDRSELGLNCFCAGVETGREVHTARRVQEKPSPGHRNSVSAPAHLLVWQLDWLTSSPKSLLKAPDSVLP